ncbi:hypothetical protein AaE_002695, partial [Aphanomyces astaci]
DRWTTVTSCTVYGVFRAEQLFVPQYRCADAACEHATQFDGFYHGFLRTAGSTFMDIDLVNLVRLNLVVGATPLSATYRVVQGLYSARGLQFCSKSTFVTACWAILYALEVDLVSCFKCPHCGNLDTAPIIVGDGNAKMACRREFSSPKVECARDTTPNTGVSIDNRTFIRDPTTRKMLLHFCGSRAKQGDHPPALMTVANHAALRARLVHHASVLAPLFDMILANETDERGLCTRKWKTFLSDLARHSPVQNGVVRNPSSMGPTLLALADESSRPQHLPAALACLQANMPAFAQTLRETNMDVQPFHIMWAPLSGVLRRLATEFCNYLDQLPAVECLPRPMENVLYADDELHEWFPGAPVRNLLRTYEDHHRADDTICTKNSPGARYKMPGIFHFCCPHGICLGFSVLHDYESPMHPFSILCQRWTQTEAMRIVIMDNACNLHTYCLRREPWLFRNVWFVVDRLHYFNHINCSSGYRIDNFPFLRDISTVTCEVFNATFKAVVKQAGFMNMSHFIVFTKHYIREVNERRVQQVGLEVARASAKRE